jgi:hypothetical protein
MKTLRLILSGTLLAAFLAASATCLAAETKKPAKPYSLKTCLVSDEELGGMGDPYVFTYKDREIKLCCKGCLKKFDKDPAKYVKKLEEAEKKAKK